MKPTHPAFGCVARRLSGEALANEAYVTRCGLDREQAWISPGDREHCGVDRRRRTEQLGRKTTPSTEAPPRRPTCADEVDGELVCRLCQRASDLPLDNEIRAHESARWMIKKPVQDRRRVVERWIREHAIRRSGKRKLDGVALEDGDAVGSGEPPRQPSREQGVDFDGEDPRSAVCERGSECAGSGTELDHMIGRRNAGIGREA
jgi:hypothetical protein